MNQLAEFQLDRDQKQQDEENLINKKNTELSTDLQYELDHLAEQIKGVHTAVAAIKDEIKCTPPGKPSNPEHQRRAANQVRKKRAAIGRNRPVYSRKKSNKVRLEALRDFLETAPRLNWLVTSC